MITLFAALLLQAAAATPAPCTANAPPPAGLEAWSVLTTITKGPLPIGKGAGTILRPVAQVAFVVPPERAPKDGTFGGTFKFDIAQPGTYRIALETGAWIDVLRDGKPVASVAHAMGPACSGIRKIVDFAFVPGAYTLQLSGAPVAGMRMLIAPK